MPIRLFPSHDDSDLDSLDVSLNEHLSAPSVQLTALWQPGPTISLYALWVRPKGTAWKPLIETTFTTNTGEIAWDIGRFPIGTEIDIHFGLFAVSADVPKLVVYVIQGGSQAARLLPPLTGDFKALKRATTWETEATYKIKGVSA